MKLRTFLIAGVSALFGLCLALLIVSSTSAQIQQRADGLDEVPQDLVPKSKALERTDLFNDKEVDQGPTAGQAPAAQPSPAKTGRFQMAPWFVDGKSELFMIDTTTGACWHKTSGNSVWQPCAPPIPSP